MFIIIPLMIAVQTEKLSITAALDLIVWYIAISFGIFIFKTPLKLYFTIRAKRNSLEEHKEFYGEEKYNEIHKNIFTLEWKMLISSIVAPFLALFSWYCLEQFCVKYSLSSLSQMLHPYFIILAAFVSSYQPIFSFIDVFRERVDQVYGMGSGSGSLGGVKSPPTHLSGSYGFEGSSGAGGVDLSSSGGIFGRKSSPLEKSSDSNFVIDENLIKNFVYTNQKVSEDNLRSELNQFRQEFSSYLKNFNQEINSLKRDIKQWTGKKSDDILKLDHRILSLENQLELFQMLEKEKKTSDVNSIFQSFHKFIK
ncbi:hypothetical protein CYY_006981 [Polysphondylium violaceum]|uniref:Transmembrane protein n=1 Tax=Polysphondylium violaceum TaxID=133409 RepID=A0A8J4UXX9_9MYCE|nr:hypothetical protein CYY_006981 [Polysphondylium violaceum]